MSDWLADWQTILLSLSVLRLQELGTYVTSAWSGTFVDFFFFTLTHERPLSSLQTTSSPSYSFSFSYSYSSSSTDWNLKICQVKSSVQLSSDMSRRNGTSTPPPPWYLQSHKKGELGKLTARWTRSRQPIEENIVGRCSVVGWNVNEKL